MQRKILIAVTVVALGVSLAPPAFAAADDYRGRDGYRERDGYRDRDGHRRYDHDDHSRRDKRFVVHYHLDGVSRRVHVKSGDRADRTEEFLHSVGASAHADGRVVHYRMRGGRREVRRSHEDAHRLAQKLQGYGFHARVEHDCDVPLSTVIGGEAG